MELTEELEGRLRGLTHAFLEENREINLSAFRTEELTWIGNVLDSLAAVDVLSAIFPEVRGPNSEACPESYRRVRILDLGTGGGFPLLPLAIVFPHMQCVGIDSVGKKVETVKRIAHRCEIPNVTLLCTRAEDMGRDAQHRETYDVVLARAVAPLNVLLEYGAPLTKVGGHLLFWKSTKIDEELSDSLLARSELSCRLTQVAPYTLPENFGTRQILVFKKMFGTSPKYPRTKGTAKKNPLK